MVLAKIGGHYINLEAIAEAHLDDRPNDSGHTTYASIMMIGGGATILYGEEAIAFIDFLDRQAKYTVNDPRN